MKTLIKQIDTSTLIKVYGLIVWTSIVVIFAIVEKIIFNW